MQILNIGVDVGGYENLCCVNWEWIFFIGDFTYHSCGYLAQYHVLAEALYPYHLFQRVLSLCFSHSQRNLI